ncbi:MAG: hypothetical protein IJ704_05790 [Bacilli bacterium]|nr:hypothetical protein [Bacilli bacterium]
MKYDEILFSKKMVELLEYLNDMQNPFPDFTNRVSFSDGTLMYSFFTNHLEHIQKWIQENLLYLPVLNGKDYSMARMRLLERIQLLLLRRALVTNRVQAKLHIRKLTKH